MTSPLTRAQAIEQGRRRLNEIFNAPVVDLGQLNQATLYAQLILSLEMEAMKHETARQHQADVIHADQCITAFSEAVRELAKCYENLTQRGVLIDDIEFILSPKESLLLLVGKLQEAKERQIAKDRAYMEAAE